MTLRMKSLKRAEALTFWSLQILKNSSLTQVLVLKLIFVSSIRLFLLQRVSVVYMEMRLSSPVLIGKSADTRYVLLELFRREGISGGFTSGSFFRVY